MATHSSVLAWRITGTRKPDGLPSVGSHRVGQDWSVLAAHASKVMLKILKARFQQYVNCELPDVQTGFRKGRGTRDQIANNYWIIQLGDWDWHIYAAAAAAKSLQSCPTLAIPQKAAHQAPPSLRFSRQEHWSGLPFPSPMHQSEKRKVKVKSLSHVRTLAWTAAYQASPSTGFSRQEYWSGVPLPSPIYMLVCIK